MSGSPLHQTVLLQEAVEALAVKPAGTYVDGTFGRGGHSRAILERLGANGRLVAFDRDPQAVAAAQSIQDEMAEKTMVKRAEVEEAQKAVIAIARQLADAGEIVLGTEGNDYV